MYALEHIPAGRKVIEYTGERISRRETKRRGTGSITYLFTLDDYWTIDGAVGGSGAEIINHSCDPNLYTKIFKGHILYMSKRPIRPGEELTVDYRFSDKIDKSEVPVRRSELPWDDQPERVNRRRQATMEVHVFGSVRSIRHPCCRVRPLPAATPDADEIGKRITANSLKADVSFLASDALQGRGTPSPGLDIAGEFVAAQFRRAGLEPAGDDGYFQTAPYVTITPNLDGLQLTFEISGKTVTADKTKLTLSEPAAVELKQASAFWTSLEDAAALDGLSPDQVRGKVLILGMPQASGGSRRRSSRNCGRRS